MNKLFVSDYCVFPLYTGLTVAIVASDTGTMNQYIHAVYSKTY